MSIGESLTKTRRQAGLTVTQVSQRTRIRETIITGIEDDDYSACGGDFYARGHIRSIARVVGADPEPLILEYDTNRLGPLAMPDSDTDPIAPVRVHERRRLNWAAGLGLALAAALGLAAAAALGLLAYHVIAGSGHAASTAPAGRRHPATHSHPGAGGPTPEPKPKPKPKPKTASPAAVPARALIPASAVAFNPYGSDQGSSTDPGRRAIDGSHATGWHTDWYATARLGNLYPGTGLLVDMGRPVTITAVQVTLGRARGADFQLRVGTAPALADLRPVANAAGQGGVIRLRLTAPAAGRYLLLWFTRLPPDPAGTFQASVYDLRLDGRAAG